MTKEFFGFIIFTLSILILVSLAIIESHEKSQAIKLTEKRNHNYLISKDQLNEQ
jgi:hypothetical protein